MLRFFMSSQQRKLISELEELELFSDDLPLKLDDYQLYFRQLVIIEPSMTKQLTVLLREKHTPIMYVKALAFVHTWLQATCIIEEPEPVLAFLNALFNEVSASAEKLKKNRLKSQSKMTKSQTVNISELRYKQLEWSKELFLLEEVVKPYLYYLQKLISIFEFYNSLKKNFIKPMNQSEIWVLVNLFHSIEKITNNVNPICKFIRKSYRPVAEALAILFSQDISNFYPKLYKYSYGEANKLRYQYFDLSQELGEDVAFGRVIEGVDGMANLLIEISQINRALKSLYEEPTVHNLDNIYIPKIIEVEGPEFQFIAYMQRIKKEQLKISQQGLQLNLRDFQDYMTPKFKTIEAQSLQSQQSKEEEERAQDRVMSIFRDITNDDESMTTFRKDEFQFKSAFKKNLKESEGDEYKIANSYELQIKNA